MPKRPLHPGRRQTDRQRDDRQRDDRHATSPSSDRQPGLPTGSARLLAIRREGDTVWLDLEGGLTYEVAAASLPADVPEPGGELTPALHREVALASERKRAARRLFALLDRRLQPVAKLGARLLDEGYAPEAVGAVLEAMHERGVHSDRQYADAWCRDCLLSKAVGRRYLESKLRDAGVDPAVAREAAAAALDARAEDELAERAAVACWRRSARAEPRDVARVVRFLLGRGFDPATAARAARRTRPSPTR